MFTQYITDIDHIRKEAVAKHTEVVAKLEEARKRSEAVQGNPDLSATKKASAQEDFEAAQREYRRELEHVEDEANAAFARLRRSLEAHVAKFAAVDPEKVDQSTVMLLNSGAMLDTDLVALAGKFGDNPTMLRLICAEAEKMLDASVEARLLAVRIKKYTSPGGRLEVFDQAVDIARRTFQRDTYIANAFARHWDEHFYEELRQNMAALDDFVGMEVA